MKKIKFVLKILGYILLTIIIIYNIIMIVNPDYVLDICGIQVFVLEKGQEQDKLPENTMIIATKKFEEIEINDIVVIKISGSVFFHRIIEKKEGYYTTKGDGNLKADSVKYKLNDIDAKVIATIPYIGFILALSKQKIFSVLICIIIIIYIIYNRHIFKKRKERRRKQQLNKIEKDLQSNRIKNKEDLQ